MFCKVTFQSIVDVNQFSLWKDRADDLTAGVKSTALLFGSNTKPVLHVFTAATAALWAQAGLAADVVCCCFAFFVVWLSSTARRLATMMS